jgi:hypothetical protein
MRLLGVAVLGALIEYLDKCIGTSCPLEQVEAGTGPEPFVWGILYHEADACY